MSKQIQVTVDGRIIETESGVMLLDILNQYGIYVPQLCSHPSLLPNGACRLCMVEITRQSWEGRSKLVTSCLYPAEDGLIVSTRSKDVLKTRRSLLELYLAQCPGSDVVSSLARLEGIDTTPFEARGSAGNNCVMCGLCTRVCQDCGPGAIATLGRGADKLIGPNPEGVGEECTGCRACAYICPTGAIPVQQQDQRLTIWKRSFEIPVCSVRPELCRGCGICEEICPESIPRVTMLSNGTTVSKISPTACVGCGICAGSCPTGAIKQLKTAALTDYEQALRAGNLTGKQIVFVCPRSPMPPDAADVIRVSCIGSVDISTLLYCFAAGASAVALICRDRLSCPYQQGGDLGEQRVSVAGELLELCGMAWGRLAVLQPDPGPEGPFKAWQSFQTAASQYPPELTEAYVPAAECGAGMDLALDIVGWLKSRPELKPALPAAVESLLDTDAESATVLDLGRLPELSLLFSLTMAEPVVIEILEQAARLLEARGITVRCAAAPKDLTQGGAERVIAFTPPDLSSAPAALTFTTLNELAGLTAVPEELEQFTFQISAQHRRQLLDQYDRATEQYLCATPERCLQYALLFRRGAWQQLPYTKPAMLFASALSAAQKPGQRQQKAARRVDNHPILPPLPPPELTFSFNGAQLMAREGEVISSALYAAGITVFGRHHKDGAAQGIYCVNGQCSQCMVMADGKPVKACMTAVAPGMKVQSVEGAPALRR
jgi:bidirectional [NiFe] hydrogenase diaphorase subunit